MKRAPWRFSAQTDVPLARALRKFTLLVAGVVILLGVVSIVLATLLSQQIKRLGVLDKIDAARTHLTQTLSHADVILTDDHSAEIKARMTALAAQLQAYDTLDPQNALSIAAQNSLMEAMSTIAHMADVGAEIDTTISKINNDLQYFSEEHRYWRKRLDSKARLARQDLQRAETHEAALNSDLLHLSRSIFAGSALRNEIESAIRFNQAAANRTTANSPISLPRTRLPMPCDVETNPDENAKCKPSLKRVHTALDAILDSPPDQIMARLDLAYRALAAYVRVGEKTFQDLLQEINVAAEQTKTVRERLDFAEHHLGRLRLTETVLLETTERLAVLAAGDLSQVPHKNRRLRTNFNQIHFNIARTANAVAEGNFIAAQLDSNYRDMKDSWAAAYDALNRYRGDQDTLSNHFTDIGSTLVSLAQQTHARANFMVNLKSSAALIVLGVFAAIAVGLFWGGQILVVRPLATTTKAILSLAEGKPVKRIRLNQRSFGLEILENSLEKLRLANIERDELTQKTIEQRQQIQKNLEDLAEKTREMAYLARHDPLTSLGNRRGADDHLSEISGGPERNKADFSLFHVDIDRFKEINDTLGHDAGDAVLVNVSKTINDLMDDGDRAFRIGGDEFLIVRSPRRPQSADRTLANAIIEALNQPVNYKGHACRIGASIGIAHGRYSGYDGKDVLVNADIALYEAKYSGRNQFVEFSKSLQEKTVNRKSLSDQILVAIENDEFVPYYQPQFYGDTLALRGIETLCRWQHPELGVLSPAHFMEQAEASKLLGKIDQILLAKASDDLEFLQAQGHVIPKISFNITADRLLHADLAQSLTSGFNTTTRIAVELLESMSLDSLSEAVRWAIDALKEQGVAIEIDDFGSCRASIAGLIAVGPDAMKIDGTIVAPILDSPQHLHLVRAIIDIGQALGIEVVAERVETDQHVQVLRDLGCDVLQGFGLAEPMSIIELSDYLSLKRPNLSIG